jgi:hypothetical protein
VARYYTFRVLEIPENGFLRWDEHSIDTLDKRQLDTSPRETGVYAELPSALADSSRLKALAKDLQDTIYKDFGLNLQYSRLFNLYSSPDEDPGVFEARLRQAAREKRDSTTDDVMKKFAARMDRLEERQKRKALELEKDEARVARENQSSIIDIAGGLLSIFGGRRSSTTLTRIGKAAAKTVSTSTAEASRDKRRAELVAIDEEIAALSEEMQQALKDAQTAFDEEATRTEPYVIRLKRTGIELDFFALTWVPHFAFVSEGMQRLAPADA